MSKQKEIEEMADVLWGHCGNLINEYCEGKSHCANCIAKKLTDAGYRKADEVRKETAKEILQDLYDEASKYCDDTMGLNTYEIKQLANKYGVEVDE